MRQCKLGRWTGCALAMAGLLWGSRLATVEGAPPVRKPAASKSAGGAPPVSVEDFKSSGDPNANIAALKKEKLETVQMREEFLRSASQAGKAKQSQLDHITLDLLNAQLELIEKPSLRIETREKIITILKRQEAQAEQDLIKVQRSSDIDGLVGAHGKATVARLRRINAQLDLERERAALEKEEMAAGKQ